MKSLPMSLHDKVLLNARNMAETIIGQIKEFSSLNLSRHRSVINAFVHIIAAITASRLCALWDGRQFWDSGHKASIGAGLRRPTMRSRPDR
jgi:hypothetical protein